MKLDETTVNLFNDKLIDGGIKYLIVHSDLTFFLLDCVLTLGWTIMVFMTIHANMFLRILGAAVAGFVFFIVCMLIFLWVFSWIIQTKSDSNSKYYPSWAQKWYIKKQEGQRDRLIAMGKQKQAEEDAKFAKEFELDSKKDSE